MPAVRTMRIWLGTTRTRSSSPGKRAIISRMLRSCTLKLPRRFFTLEMRVSGTLLVYFLVKLDSYFVKISLDLCLETLWVTLCIISNCWQHFIFFNLDFSVCLRHIVIFLVCVDGHMNVWSIDLHGLHGTEAVMALQERLTFIEKELSTNPTFLYSQSQRTPEHEQPLPLAASRAIVKNELSVITGTHLLKNAFLYFF